jgi:hypothetical protein
VTDDSPQPLWRASVGETEPWRRGRLALILMGAVTLACHASALLQNIFSGNIEQFLALAIGCALFWLQFYFIWIGIHWVRWLQGFLSALWGFTLLIWGLRDSLGLVMLLGLWSFLFGVYLALAPSIYFFAQRQREARNWAEVLIAAVVFLLILACLVSTCVGLFACKAKLEADARRFAQVAFKRIFAEHDTYFLCDHASDNLLKIAGGRPGASRFLQDATMRVGDVDDIGPVVGRLQFSYHFPFSLASFGPMAARGRGLSNHIVQMEARLVDNGAGWQIDTIEWFYPGTLGAPR